MQHRPADLPPDEFARLATLMLRLHADFRQRHGLPPVRSAWSLLEDVDALKRKGAVNDRAVIASPRVGFGWLLERMRWLLWRALKPVFDRQAEVNHESIRAIEALIRDSYRSRDRQQDLDRRIQDLERRISGIRTIRLKPDPDGTTTPDPYRTLPRQ